MDATCGAPWADLIGIGRVSRQADTAQRQFNRAKPKTAHGRDRAICIESTAVGVCIAHRLQIPVHRLAHLSPPQRGTDHATPSPSRLGPSSCVTVRIGRTVGFPLAARH